MKLSLNDSSAGFVMYSVSVIMSFVNSRILIEQVGIKAFSDYSLLLNASEPIFVLSSLGLTTYVTKHLGQVVGGKFLGATILLIILAVTLISSVYFSWTGLSLIFTLAALSFCLAKFIAGISRLQPSLLVHWLLKYIIRPLSLFVVVFFFSFKKLEDIVGVQSGLMLLFILISLFVLKDIFKPVPRSQSILEGLRNSRAFLFSALPPIAITYFDKLYLVNLLNEEEYSLYSITFRLSLFVGIPLVIYNSVLTRSFVKLSTEAVIPIFKKYRWKGFTLGLLAFALLLASLPLICQFLQLPCNQTTYFYFLVLSSIQLISLFFGSSALLLSLRGFEKYVAKHLSMVAVGQILLIWILSYFSVVAAIVVPVLFGFIWNFLCFNKSKVEILR